MGISYSFGAEEWVKHSRPVNHESQRAAVMPRMPTQGRRHSFAPAAAIVLVFPTMRSIQPEGIGQSRPNSCDVVSGCFRLG